MLPKSYHEAVVQRKQRVKVWDAARREVVVEVWMNVVSWDRSTSSVKGFIRCVKVQNGFEYTYLNTYTYFD